MILFAFLRFIIYEDLVVYIFRKTNKQQMQLIQKTEVMMEYWISRLILILEENTYI